MPYAHVTQFETSRLDAEKRWSLVVRRPARGGRPAAATAREPFRGLLRAALGLGRA